MSKVEKTPSFVSHLKQEITAFTSKLHPKQQKKPEITSGSTEYVSFMGKLAAPQEWKELTIKIARDHFKEPGIIRFTNTPPDD